jgi:hypothetical protein
MEFLSTSSLLATLLAIAPKVLVDDDIVVKLFTEQCEGNFSTAPPRSKANPAAPWPVPAATPSTSSEPPS